MLLPGAVSKPKDGDAWKYSTGRITKALIQEHGFPAGDGSVAGMCGPPGMVNKACIPSLKVCPPPLPPRLRLPPLSFPRTPARPQLVFCISGTLFYLSLRILEV